jgi:hypothetical protein
LRGDIEDVGEIRSLREVREFMGQFRMLYRKLEKKVQDGAVAEQKAPAGSEAKAADEKKEASVAEGKHVGDVEETAAGFGLGKALKDSKPKQPVDVASKPKRPDDEEPEEETKGEGKDQDQGRDQDEDAKGRAAGESGAGGELQPKKEKKIEVLDRQTVHADSNSMVGVCGVQEERREDAGRNAAHEPERAEGKGGQGQDP